MNSFSEVPSYTSMAKNSDYLQTDKVVQFVSNHCPALNAIFQFRESIAQKTPNLRYSLLYRWAQRTAYDHCDRPNLRYMKVAGVIFWDKNTLISEDKRMQKFINEKSRNDTYWLRYKTFMNNNNKLDDSLCAIELLSDGWQGEA